MTVDSPKRIQPTTKTRRPAPAKSICAAHQALLDALPAQSDDDGFFISPLQDELTDEDVRKLWRYGNIDRDDDSRRTPRRP
jgi:hypothetical protein